MGKVKPINQYRLTPGFGGLALCHIRQQSAALHAAGAASKRKPPNNGGKQRFDQNDNASVLLACHSRHKLNLTFR
ncbi:hypothetical protein ECD28_21200 [Salmonella enterica subsp. enterica]|nr:hypothetical protein [Salmonella enterica subsp. enterica serovar Typhimurium]